VFLAVVVVAALALAVAGLVDRLLTPEPATTLRAGTATGTVLVPDPGAYGAAGDPLPDRAVYVVRPGDTLWSIARAVAPDADVVETAARLAEINGSSALQVGQRLRLN
jgi:Tfp pilus assembly protein FimV